MIKAIILLFFISYATGCTESQPVEEGKYTIWIGSSVVAAGYDTDEYKKDGDFLTFTTKRGGEAKIIPMHSLYKIDINQP